jgi:hypothetical protein
VEPELLLQTVNKKVHMRFPGKKLTLCDSRVNRLFTTYTKNSEDKAVNVTYCVACLAA